MEKSERRGTERGEEFRDWRRGDDMARLKGFAYSVAADGLHDPSFPLRIVAELLEPAIHENAAAGRLDFTGGGFPHHAGAAARITKRFDQGFGAGATPRLKSQGPRDAIDECLRKIEPLDSLGRPIGRNLIAIHAPDLFGIGLEEDRKKPFAEFITHPLMEGLGIADWKRAGMGIGGNAGDALLEPEIAQGLKSLQRIGIEFSRVINARQPRPVEKIVRKDFIPKIHHFPRFREKAVATDIE